MPVKRATAVLFALVMLILAPVTIVRSQNYVDELSPPAIGSPSSSHTANRPSPEGTLELLRGFLSQRPEDEELSNNDPEHTEDHRDQRYVEDDRDVGQGEAERPEDDHVGGDSEEEIDDFELPE